MKTFVIIGSIISLSLTFAQCRKDDDHSIPEQKWKSSNLFTYENKIQTNSLVVDDKILFMGYNFAIGKVDETTSESISTKLYSKPLNKNQYKPVLSSSFYVYPIGKERMRFQSNFNHTHNEGDKVLYFPKVDSLFSEFEYLDIKRGVGALVNNKQQCLIPYHVKFPSVVNGATGEIRLLIASLGEKNNIYGDVIFDTIADNHIITDQGIYFLNDLNVVEEYFFVSLENKTIRISSDYSVENSFNGVLTEIFKHKDRYIGISKDGTYQSFDKGLTWQKKFQTQWVLANSNFYQIEDQVFAVYRDQIFHFDFDFSGNILHIKEILNEGLEGELITSLALFNDKIYVSTLSGIYEENYQTFFEYDE